MAVYCYAFEAKSIQRFIASGGRLRDMVAASDLLDSFCRKPLDDLIAAVGCCDSSRMVAGKVPVNFSRRAGGAIRLFSERADAAFAIRDLIGLVLPSYAPGLEFVHAVGEAADALAASAAATQQLVAFRNLPAISLPEASPLAMRCSRTGEPAIGGKGDDAEDAGLARKRRWSSAHREGLAERIAQGTDSADVLQWPRQLEPQDRALPAVIDADASARGLSNVAVVHADGNGLGLFLIRLHNAMHGQANLGVEKVGSALMGFSRALESATLAATRSACREVLFPAAMMRTPTVVPARPLVLGGDDMTFIVRADLAMPFAMNFLQAFEREATVAISSWKATLPLDIADQLPSRLTAAAGIAYVKARMPYTHAHELAENLCRQAKSGADRMVESGMLKPSSLAFARVTTSLSGEPDSLVGYSRHHTTDGVVQRARLGVPAYGLSRGEGLPAIDDLLELRRYLIAAGNEKPLRALLNLMQIDEDLAKDAYRRWRDVAERSLSLGKRWVKGWDERLKNLGCGSCSTDLPLICVRQEWVSPLADLMAVLAVTTANEETDAHA